MMERMNLNDFTHRPCPVCSSGLSEQLTHLSFPLFDGTPIAGEMDVLSCRACGFIFYDTPSTGTDFDDFYRDHYHVRSYALRDNHGAESAYLAETVDILRRGGVDPESYVVDVGCGPGHFLRRLHEAGFRDLMGVELCEDYVREMAQCAIPARLGSALSLPLGERLADCLIYKNIFEHFLDFNAVLDEIEARLAPDGAVFIEVPDASRYADFSDYAPLSYFTLEHINHFDPIHLQALFSRRGYELMLSGTRMLDIAERYPIPIQHALFRRQGAGGGQEIKDFTLAACVQTWLPSPAYFMSAELEALRDSRVPVHVWGLSYRTLSWLGMSALKDCEIRHFVDADPRKQALTLMGRPIRSPDILQDIGADEAVVIGVGPSSPSMRLMLEAWGFSGNVVVLH